MSRKAFLGSNEITVFASAARTDSGSPHSSSDIVSQNYDKLIATLDISAASGTTPTLDVKFQHYDEASSKWVDIPGMAFAQQVGVATVVLLNIDSTGNFRIPLGKKIKAVATIGGTTPSFTFSLGVILKS